MKYYSIAILMCLITLQSCKKPVRQNLEGEKYTAQKDPRISRTLTISEIHSVLEFHKDSVDIYITHDSIRTTEVIHRVPYYLKDDTLILSHKIKGLKRGDTLFILDEKYSKQ